MELKYPPFLASKGLRDAARNSPALRVGARGSSIAVLQGALLDIGYDLPKSINKQGLPDGVFGNETLAAIKNFQGEKVSGLAPDGVVGKDTMFALDMMMFSMSPVVHVPPKPIAPAVNAHYQLGTADPPHPPDPGAGPWNSKPTLVSHFALKQAIIQILPEAYVVIGDDATKHMAHYLGNSGATLTVDLEDMINDVRSARERFEAEAAQAKAFVESLPPGKHDITSRMIQGGYNYKEENWNWFFAIGGYASWGKGSATVTVANGGHDCVLDFEYKFFDRYNWDKGKSVTIFKVTVTDAFMGEFHRQGLAQEFDCVGSMRRRFTWRKGQAIPRVQLDTPIGGGRS